jgi:ferredoxin
MMRVHVDQLKCKTYGICVQEMPEVFRFQEGSKKAKVILEEIPLSLQPKVREVALKCPARAIIVEEY